MLNQSGISFELIFAEARVGMCILDDQGRFVAINREYQELLGYTAEQLEGTFFADYTHPNDAPLDPARWADAYEGRAFRTEKRYLREDGTIVWVDLRSSQIPNPAGGWFGFVVVADITERKALEEQLRRAEKMEAIGSLVVGIAHDFNNLLTVIGGYSDLLVTRLGDDEAQQDVLEIERAAAQAAGLTRQLLAFSRRQILRPEVIDLNEVVEQTLTLLDRLIGEDIELVREFDPALGRVIADRGQLTQVVLNLALNARDAIPRGGKLTMRTANVDVEPDQAQGADYRGVTPGPYALLQVADTGVGMDETTLNRIFDPFFTTKEGGTGLGLAIVYGIVSQSEGHIRAHSEVGGGTTIDIYLPRAAAPTAAEREPERRRTAEGQPHVAEGGETILVVEDDERLRRLVARVLESHGYAVLLARSAIEALELAEQHEPSIGLLFTDVVMPGMNGRELAEQLRSARPLLKVLLTSGYPDDTLLRHGITAGHAAFIEKPYAPTELVLKVRELLDA